MNSFIKPFLKLVGGLLLVGALLTIIFIVVLILLLPTDKKLPTDPTRAAYVEKLQSNAASVRNDFASNRATIIANIQSLLDQKKYAAAVSASERYTLTGDSEIARLLEQSRKGYRDATAAAALVSKEEDLLQRLAAKKSAKDILAQDHLLIDLIALSTAKRPDYERQAKALEPQVKRAKEAAQAALIKTARANQRNGRISMAKALDDIYLNRGIDVRVTTRGQNHDTLVLTWVLFSRPNVHKLVNDKGGFVPEARANGFKDVVFQTGFGESWSYTLN